MVGAIGAHKPAGGLERQVDLSLQDQVSVQIADPYLFAVPVHILIIARTPSEIDPVSAPGCPIFGAVLWPLSAKMYLLIFVFYTIF